MAVATAPNGNQAAQLPPIPFSKATVRKRVQMSNYTPQAGLGGVWNNELNSQGYMAGIRFLFAYTDTVGTANNTAMTIDFPYNIVQRYMLSDTLGNNLHNCKGYSMKMAERFFQPMVGRNELWGALSGDVAAAFPSTPDPRLYVAVVTGSQAALPVVFAIDAPVETDEVQHLGLMPNQNASFKYQTNLTFDVTANILTPGASGTNAWAGTLQPVYDYYTVPQPVNGMGRRQMTLPPYPGVVRQIRDETFPCTTGGTATSELRYNLTPGMVIRGFTLVSRSSTLVRVGNSLTTGIQRVKIMYGDDTLLQDYAQQDFINTAYRRYGVVPPMGVYPFTWTRDLAGLVGQSRSTDVLDTRGLAQLYLLITTGTDVYNIDVIHDDLIVPQGMTI